MDTDIIASMEHYWLKASLSTIPATIDTLFWDQELEYVKVMELGLEKNRDVVGTYVYIYYINLSDTINIIINNYNNIIAYY